MVDHAKEKAERLAFRELFDSEKKLTITKVPQVREFECGCIVKKYIHPGGAYIVEQDWCDYHATEEGIG